MAVPLVATIPAQTMRRRPNGNATPTSVAPQAATTQETSTAATRRDGMSVMR